MQPTWRYAPCSTSCAIASPRSRRCIWGEQLPLLIRGLYYEGWRLAEKPAGERRPDEFAALVAAQMPPRFARDALRVTKAVFNVLAKELDHGEIAKIIAALPIPLRSLWPAKAA